MEPSLVVAEGSEVIYLVGFPLVGTGSGVGSVEGWSLRNSQHHDIFVVSFLSSVSMTTEP